MSENNRRAVREILALDQTMDKVEYVKQVNQIAARNGIIRQEDRTALAFELAEAYKASNVQLIQQEVPPPYQSAMLSRMNASIDLALVRSGSTKDSKKPIN